MKKLHFVLLAVAVVVAIALAGSYFFTEQNPQMSYPDFLAAVQEKTVEKAVMSDGNTFLVQLAGQPDTYYTVPNPKTENFIEFLLESGITVEYGQGDIYSDILRGIMVAGIVGAAFWYLRRGGVGSMQVKDAAKTQTRSSITLAQVAGNIEAKQMVADVIQFIKDPKKYASVGARMPKGLLLYGPPGTGKTLMAKAIAGEADVPFYSMSGSDFVQMYVGVGASRVRSLFQKAKKNEKAVIFIDEIDAIGKKRARSVSASNDERDQTLNALLTEMSGFHDNEGIVVIGATNRIDTLDEALLRPGRFDRQIEIGLPDVGARRKILDLYAKSKPLSQNVDLGALAKSTVYFSGAMLENLLNEAAITAANEGSDAIASDHIDRAFYTVLAGAPKTDRSYISKRDSEVCAYHEAGHALVTALLLPEHTISKVTIIPSVRGAGGFNLSIPNDTLFQSQRQLRANIQVLLAGRAAEEIIYGAENVTTGAQSDIQKASSLIVDYIDRFGMDADMGMFSTRVLENGGDDKLVQRCRQQMTELYGDTRELLTQRRDLLESIAAELLQKESLSGEDIIRICA